jgi:hypothetical protein
VSKSLQDQLLALGLAKNAAREAPRPPRNQKPVADRRAAAKPATPGRKPADPKPVHQPRPDLKADENISLEQAYRIREAHEKTAKQKARDLKMEEDRKRAALNRQIKQIIEAGRLNLPDAAEARYFMYKDRIRKVHVSPEQLLDLNSGKLGVVYLTGGYHVLASAAIEEVRKLSPTHVPDLLAGSAEDDFSEREQCAADLLSEEASDEPVEVAGEENSSPDA